MFCSQCGQSNIENAKFCSSCGSKLENFDESQAAFQQPTKNDNELLTGHKKKQPRLWNPNAAINWSLLLTPVFGSYLQMKNWQEIGSTTEANNAKYWLVGTIIFILFLNLGTPFIWDDPYQLQTYPKSLGILYIIVWYFAFAKSQSDFVKKHLHSNYQKKSWGIPLIIASIILISSFTILMATSSTIIDAKYKSSALNNQKKPWEMDWDQTNSQVQTEQNTNAENHSEKYVQESNSSNPFSDPNYGKDLNISDKTQSAEQLHYDSILAAHPDALEIAKQKEFENWINSHSPEWRKYYDDVANSGTADQVIQMMNDYKANIIH
ncbi:zinc-ribbon domain-containing protein [Acinetobacter lwoffii]|uniref:zinc ribbon domain-containing protein n=1 Tax=Acinetobacter lwoffii TaxID=28090 RepID=UPI003F91627E